MRLQIVDDSGILGLLDCSTYSTFVGEDWEYEQLVEHIRQQAASKCIVMWDAGDGGNDYRVDIHLEAIQARGYREASSQIVVRDSRLHLASYTAITMAAQFADERLPARTEADCYVPLPNGEYVVRVIQMYVPTNYDEPAEDAPHFVIEILTASGANSENVLWLQV